MYLHLTAIFQMCYVSLEVHCFEESPHTFISNKYAFCLMRFEVLMAIIIIL
jgi:hypothetical protein